jgi:hypothetical protein
MRASGAVSRVSNRAMSSPCGMCAVGHTSHGAPRGLRNSALQTCAINAIASGIDSNAEFQEIAQWPDGHRSARDLRGRLAQLLQRAAHRPFRDAHSPDARLQAPLDDLF